MPCAGFQFPSEHNLNWPLLISEAADEYNPPDDEIGDDEGSGDPPPPPSGAKEKMMDGERVVFTNETNPQNYLKLVASGDVDGTMLEALEEYVKRQKRRLGIEGPIQSGIAKAKSNQANDE